MRRTKNYSQSEHDKIIELSKKMVVYDMMKTKLSKKKSMRPAEFSQIELEQIKNRKEKPCTTCHVPKGLNYFGKKPTAIDGRTSQCLECQRKQQAIIRMGRKMLNYV